MAAIAARTGPTPRRIVNAVAAPVDEFSLHDLFSSMAK
jgi:hypothetical protein